MIRGMLREVYFGGEVEVLAELAALCPACDFEHAFRVDLDGHGKWGSQGVWSFDGNYENPTFNPSMGANLHQIEKHHPACHSFLENGVWRFLEDCTHGMAGQRVPMIPPDPQATFEIRHGWHLFPWTDDKGKQANQGA